jgi:hypothetical protein
MVQESEEALTVAQQEHEAARHRLRDAKFPEVRDSGAAEELTALETGWHMKDALAAHEDTGVATYILARMRNWDGMDDTVTYAGQRGQDADHVAKLRLMDVYDEYHNVGNQGWRRHPLYDDMARAQLRLMVFAIVVVTPCWESR